MFTSDHLRKHCCSIPWVWSRFWRPLANTSNCQVSRCLSPVPAGSQWQHGLPWWTVGCFSCFFAHCSQRLTNLQLIRQRPQYSLPSARLLRVGCLYLWCVHPGSPVQALRSSADARTKQERLPINQLEERPREKNFSRRLTLPVSGVAVTGQLANRSSCPSGLRSQDQLTVRLCLAAGISGGGSSGVLEELRP